MRLDLHWVSLDKAPRLSIRIVIWILPSDTVFVNSIQMSANTETAMLSSSSVTCTDIYIAIGVSKPANHKCIAGVITKRFIIFSRKKSSLAIE